MPPSVVFCPGGTTSQTGAAVRDRYPDAQIKSCGKIPAVLDMLPTEVGPYVIPIWNSHEGEVMMASYFWNSIEEQTINIEDVWAKPINFWFVRRAGTQAAYGFVGSVAVAGTQCSGFLEKRALTLVKRDLTTTAFDEFRLGAEWDGVLVAPGQGDESGFEISEKDTANPNNFTTFVRLVPRRAFSPSSSKTINTLTGIRMRAFDVTLRDDEVEFFDRLLGSVTEVSNLPKLVFVFDRDSKVGLLFEGVRIYAADLLDAEQLNDDSIAVFENAGETLVPYSAELKQLFSSNFPTLATKDFIKHLGVKSCLFACPPLGIYTHGFEPTRVEPVVRYYISKLFSLWDEGVLECTEDQKAFFERHHESWAEKRSEFVEFETVTAT